MVEWFIAPVLKTGDPKGSVGSNPTPSATLILNDLCRGLVIYRNENRNMSAIFHSIPLVSDLQVLTTISYPVIWTLEHPPLLKGMKSSPFSGRVRIPPTQPAIS
jgi:hypothetical protein